MTQITFLVGPFHPNFSAVGYCAYQVQKCLLDSFDVSTIAFRDDPSQSLEGQLDAIQIHRIETSEMRATGLARSATGRIAGARLITLRLKGALRRLLSSETINRHLVRAYHTRLKAMDPEPDVIVPVAFPFETVLAALAYKRTHPRAIVVPYLFDDFVDSGSLHVLKLAREIKRPLHLCLERQMLMESDAVLAMHPLRRHLEDNFDSTQLAKVMFLEHPLMSPPAKAAERGDDGITTLCFTGSLIKNVREADYLISLLGGLQIERPVRADFFVMGNVARKVRSGILANGLEIVNHGCVPKAEADAAVARADVLINIGEKTGRQISSKIFEYMATGKPIIHLAHVRSDANTTILAKYPLALCLIEDRSMLKENARRVSNLIGRVPAQSLTFEEVSTIYPEAIPTKTADVLKYIVHNSQILFGTEK